MLVRGSSPPRCVALCLLAAGCWLLVCADGLVLLSSALLCSAYRSIVSLLIRNGQLLPRFGTPYRKKQATVEAEEAVHLAQVTSNLDRTDLEAMLLLPFRLHIYLPR